MKRFFTQKLIASSLSPFIGTKLFCLTSIACLVFFFSNLTTVHGQAADAVNALQICDGIWTEPAQTASTGSVDDLFNATSKGCLTGEHGSNWYYIKVNTSGSMAVSVQGIQASGLLADIDGAFFGPFTSVSAGATAISTGAGLAPLRCSFATGKGFELQVLNNETSESTGGDGVIGAINVTAGQYYLVFVDNVNVANASRAVSISWTFTTGNNATYECPTIPTTCGSSCGMATCPVADRGIFSASGVQPAGSFTYTQCNSYQTTPFKAGDGTFLQCYTVNSDGYGNLGVVQSILVRGDDSDGNGSVDSLLAIANSRTATLTLASNPCGLTILPTRTKAGNDATFNPEWDNLTPNTTYILCISTTMPQSAVTKSFNYRQSCVDVYHYASAVNTLYPACTAPPRWWYKANAGVSTVTNGTSVDFWNDQTNNATNVTQTGTARPIYNTNGINFNPSLSFNGSQNLLRTATTGLSGGDKTFMSVALPNVLPTATTGIIGSGGTLNEIGFGYENGKLNVFENSGNNALSTTANTTGTVLLSTAIESSNAFSFFNNGTANGTGSTNSYPNTNRLTIGSHNVNGGDKNFFNGQIAEVIVFDRAISATERANVESYLAIKYGITLGHDYTNSLATIIYPLSTFGNRVTIIGREDCQNLNQKQSKSADAGNWTIGLNTIAATNTANSNVFATNNTFVALGDDNGSMTATPIAVGGACLPPPATDKEIPRHWKVVSSASDSVFMQIPTASFLGLDLNQPVYMVVADDAAFATNLRTVLLIKNGANYEKKCVFTGTQYLKIIGTGTTTTYCTGSSYLQWSANPWTAGALTQTTPLSNGLSVTTTVSNPNSILLAGYPKMVGANPALFINSNSATKVVTWSMQFNQTITGAGFYIYDLDKLATINENVQITGYNGATVVNPTLSKSLASPVTINNATSTANGAVNSYPTYSSNARVYVSFNSAIDRIVITYKNNANTQRNIAESITIGDVSIYCPEAVTEADLISIKKMAPTATVRQGDIVSYTFKVTNADCTPKNIDIVDDLPTGMTWVGGSYTSALNSGTLNNYNNSIRFSLSNVAIPTGVSTFTVDAVVNASGTKNNQASFIVNGHQYLSDDPNQATYPDPTPIIVGAPLITPPVSISKARTNAVLLGTGIQTFTYTISNLSASPITMDFADQLIADTMTFVAATLSSTLGGTASAYGGQGALFITNMTIPVGTSTFTIQVAMNNLAPATFENTATIRATGATYSATPIVSNTVTWTIEAAAAFNYAFECTGSKVKGIFTANGATGQTGTIKIPINVVHTGIVTLNVSGSNFTGTITTNIIAGQSSITVPITYDGGGVEGSRLLTLTSSAGTGVCSVSVPIQSNCKSSGGRIGF
jgi:uncharacterized repeat protein (TIGR01451 family)